MYILGEQVPYPAPENKAFIQPPEGYEFVTMVHFARHGSRYAIEPDHLPKLLTKFNEIASKGQITEAGTELLHDVEQFAQWWSSHTQQLGHLTELGLSEHHAMGRRAVQMIQLKQQSSPHEQSLRITAKSSGVIRTLESQSAFLNGAAREAALTETALKISSDDSAKTLSVTNPHIYYDYPTKFDPQSAAIRAKLLAQNDDKAPESVQVFVEQFIHGLDKKDAIELTNILFELAQQDAPQNGIRGMLKPFAFWAQDNGDKALLDWLFTRNKLDKFYLFGAAEMFNGFNSEMGEPILNDFLCAIQTAITTPKTAPHLNLRFGHDGGVMAFMNRLGLMETQGSDAERMQEFLPSKQIPMAANICWQLYRNGDDYQVRMLHNERPVSFPIKGYENSEFCSWDAISRFYQQEKPVPFYPQAFSHNDYENARPLQDALDHGFGTVEADVHLIDGELYVGHETPTNLTYPQTFRAMYLEPLRQRIENNGGSVYKDIAPAFNLMVELKTDRLPTYLALRDQIAEYRDIFTVYINGERYQKAVNAVISGGMYPIDVMNAETTRYLSIDGDMTFFQKNLSTAVMPWVSLPLEEALGREPTQSLDNFSDISTEELQRAANLVAEINKQGRLARFYWVPDKPEFWVWQEEIGVGLIATDHMSRLAEHLQQ